MRNPGYVCRFVKAAAIDIDGVIADIITPLKTAHHNISGTYPDDPSQWGLAASWGLESDFDLWDKFWRSGGFYECPVISGAAETLAQMKQNGWEIHLVTARTTASDPLVKHGITPQMTLKWALARMQTKCWVADNNIPADSIVYADRKTASGTYDLLVDDCPGHVSEAVRSKVEAVCFRQPWNASEIDRSNLPFVSSWDGVLETAQRLCVSSHFG